MPRTARSLVAGGHYHVISRGNNRTRLFEGPSDCEAFVGLIRQAQQRHPLSILAACVMPNHVHFVVAQHGASDISRWMHWLLTTHGHRHHLGRETCGRVWQGRFKAFPIQRDVHLLTVMRYVERNPLRAGLVRNAEDWAWSSIAWRHRGAWQELLASPPVPLPANWLAWVNAPQTREELAALRACVNHQHPYGDELWSSSERERRAPQAAKRRRGRPGKVTDGQSRQDAADAGQQALAPATGQLLLQSD